MDFVQVKYKINTSIPQIFKTRNLFEKFPEGQKYFYKVSLRKFLLLLKLMNNSDTQILVEKYRGCLLKKDFLEK